MGSKSQRKKERGKRKRQKQELKARRRVLEIRRTIGIAGGSNARHQQRILQQTPNAWDGEATADVAVFDDAALASLPPELSVQVSAVRGALADASASRGDDALQWVSSIPRSSPMSEWRLFIRGLVAWLADDIQAAGESWARLDSERRPGRIAIAMMAALRSDLEQAAPAAESAGGGAESQKILWGSQLDAQLLYHARLLRRIRIDRIALRTAQTGLEAPEESPKLHLGPRKIRWLRQFVREHEATEPDLAAALAQTALGRAFAQNFSDLFDEAVRSFKGPRHDPRNLLLTFFYFDRFGNDTSSQKRAQRALDEYLQHDLPQNKVLSEPLRAAIASQIHLNEAMALQPSSDGGLMGSMFGRPENPKAIRQHLIAAVQAYPGNRAAYQAHVEWIESKLDDDRLTKPQRQPWEEELARVMQDWSKSLPEDVKPRLWLVDYLLENEQTELAKPHVDWMAAVRHDDPRVRATPWKWQMLEASRLCRRKAWLAQVPERLAEADRLWPEWLSRQWLAYWKVAWALRIGEADGFEQGRKKISEEGGPALDSLADACMMLGAAQWMRLPAADVKLLREPVDCAAKNLDQLPLEELLDASVFFWDLHRAGLVYPAYRMHGGKFGKELFARFSRSPKLVTHGASAARIQAAVAWCSEHRFWSDGYGLNLPSWYSASLVQQQPMFAAAKVNAFLKLRYHWRAEGYRELSPVLREAAQSQRDPYYRHWFLSLAEELDDELARSASRGPGFGSDFFGDAFGAFDEDDDYDDDDDEELDFDPNCNCPACRAAKRAYHAKK